MEFDLIELIRRHVADARSDVVCGIGDDAALLCPPPGFELAVSVDTLVEGVHFLPGTDPADLGWKTLAVNLSDLAAMGAEPAWAVLAMTLPRADADFVDGFAHGFAELAACHELALVGGDTTQGPLTLSLTVHGLVPRGQALRRAGARAGDDIYVTGPLGDAAAALACLDEPGAQARALRLKLERPQPRVEAGQALRGLAHAAIDISDGLLADLAHVCHASNVGASLHMRDLPCSPALLERFGAARAHEYALTGGDAYELCFTAAADAAEAVQAACSEAGCQALRIGRIEPEGGLRVFDDEGRHWTPAHAGWEHVRT